MSQWEICTICGVVVGNVPLHADWHLSLDPAEPETESEPEETP